MKISIIITTQNRVEFLKRALISINNQINIDFENIDVVIIDDYSTAQNKILIKKLLNEINFNFEFNILFNIKNLGANHCRNFGAKHAKGNILFFLDDDDFFHKKKLIEAINFFKENKNILVSTSYYFLIKNNKTKIMKIDYNEFRKNPFNKNIMGGASSIIVYKSFFNKIKGFDENLTSAQDWDFWIRVNKITNIGCICKPLFYYDSNNYKKITRNLKNVYSGHRKLYFKHKINLFSKNKMNIINLIILRKRLFNKNKFQTLIFLFKMIKHIKLKQFMIYFRDIVVG